MLKIIHRARAPLYLFAYVFYGDAPYLNQECDFMESDIMHRVAK